MSDSGFTEIYAGPAVSATRRVPRGSYEEQEEADSGMCLVQGKAIMLC